MTLNTCYDLARSITASTHDAASAEDKQLSNVLKVVQERHACAVAGTTVQIRIESDSW